MPSRTSSSASTSSTSSIRSAASSRSASTTTTRTTNTTTSSATVPGNIAHANPAPAQQHHGVVDDAWPFAQPANDPLAQVSAWMTPTDQHYLNEVAARSQQILQLPGNNLNGRQTVSWNDLVALDPMAAEIENILRN
ncbi:hypothetical protein LTR95_001964 [Oleoguttula sp. CCFEE 5521]